MTVWTDRKEEELKAFLQAVMKKSGAVGLALSLFEKNGHVLYDGFFGFRDEEKRLPVNEDTLFGIASCTKSFTCLALAQLQEEGKLNVQDDVSRYIPEFTGKNQPGVRIWHLMSHSGGFFPLKRIVVDEVARDLGISDESEGDLAYSDKLAAEGARRVANRLDEQTVSRGLIGRPGEYFSYCNDGYGLLSEIIRRVSGMSYADYLKRAILELLGMSRSGCDFVWPAQDENACILYRTKNGIRLNDRNFHDNAFVLNGGGAMKSTLHDMRRYLLMYLNEGRGENGVRLLSPSAMHLLLRPLVQVRPGLFYAGGQQIRSWGEISVIGHGGSLPGVSSQILWSPEMGVGTVVLCNTSNIPSSYIADTALKLLIGLEPAEPQILPAGEEWDPEILESAAGSYRSGEGAHIEIVREGKTLQRVQDGGNILLEPVCGCIGLFDGPFVKDRLTFLKRDGRVFALRSGARLIPKE